MKALVLPKIVSLNEVDVPLELVELPTPVPKPGEVRIKVSVCGVCHTELDEIEGRAPPSKLPIVLGHEVVGIIDALGAKARKFREGDRVGVGWIHSSDGGRDENLSNQFVATGRDVNGGYAEYMAVPENYAYPIPEVFTDTQAAPLLCAGGIGYRALKLTNISNGQRLGLSGFGGSAHLILQLCQHLFPETEICVFARDQIAREFARKLGATWAGDIADRSPEKLHAIIDTTPVWKPMVEALRNLLPAGRLVVNAIRKEEVDKGNLLDLCYHEDLWMEREIKSVANITHNDIAEFLPIAGNIPIQPEIETYAFEDANQALISLKRGPVKGAKVLVLPESQANR